MIGQWARVQSAASKSVQDNGGLGFANPVIYKQAQDADDCTATGCPNPTPTYSRDFYDITESEYGAGNGAYQPEPGWDYATGWGALNVANFISDVDHTTDAALSATSPEQPAVQVSTATMTSPTGNATDPADVSLGNEPSLDLTKATLRTSDDGSWIIATLSGPSLGDSPPSDAPGGNIFRVLWEYKGKVYYAEADQPGAGSFTYTSGDTGTYGNSSTYGYNTASTSHATGSFDSATHTVTIKVPAVEVGTPALGSVLTVPQAFSQLNTGALSLTTDSSDAFAPVSRDAGLADSIGEEVIVGGAAKGTASGQGSFGGGGGGRGSGGSQSGRVGAFCTKAGGPAVHARSRISAHGIRVHGIASNRGCAGHIVSVSVAIARSVAHKCRFLLPSGRFGKTTSCRPRDFRRARGTVHWSLLQRLQLPRGIYLLWAHATNSKHQTTRNTAHKHIFMRLR
jgi:hypothetical protein